MFDFIMDYVIDPALDLALCHFDVGVWIRHRITEGLLALPSGISVWLLVSGIRNGLWIMATLALVGIMFFGWLDWKYLQWWIQEGRHGVNSSFLDGDPLLEKLSIPQGDIMSTDPQETHLREALEDAHRCLNNRM